MKYYSLIIILLIFTIQSVFGQDNAFKFEKFYSHPDRNVRKTARNKAKEWIKRNADSLDIHKRFKFKRLKFNDYLLDEGLDEDLTNMELKCDSIHLSKSDFEKVLRNFKGYVYLIEVDYKCKKTKGTLSVSFYINPKGELRHVATACFCNEKKK